MPVGKIMEAKRGDGMIFVNCMEKLTMNAPRETLRVRLSAALDAGSDAVSYLGAGAAAVQVATRFTVSRECGLPPKVQKEYFKATEDQVVVNSLSPTGYPMRMLTTSPAIGAGARPSCEAHGYLLDSTGNCAYINAYNREVAAHPRAKKVSVKDKTCLCTHMRNFDCWTCGHYVYRHKDTSRRLADGTCQLLTAEHVFRDYQYSVAQRIALPPDTPT